MINNLHDLILSDKEYKQLKNGEIPDVLNIDVDELDKEYKAELEEFKFTDFDTQKKSYNRLLSTYYLLKYLKDRKNAKARSVSGYNSMELLGNLMHYTVYKHDENVYSDVMDFLMVFRSAFDKIIKEMDGGPKNRQQKNLFDILIRKRQKSQGFVTPNGNTAIEKMEKLLMNRMQYSRNNSVHINYKFPMEQDQNHIKRILDDFRRATMVGSRVIIFKPSYYNKANADYIEFEETEQYKKCRDDDQIFETYNVMNKLFALVSPFVYELS